MELNRETATESHRSLERFITAGKRILDPRPCDRCKRAKATETNGSGHGWCARCSEAMLVERRAGLQRLEDVERRLAEAKAWQAPR